MRQLLRENIKEVYKFGSDVEKANDDSLFLSVQDP